MFKFWVDDGRRHIVKGEILLILLECIDVNILLLECSFKNMRFQSFKLERMIVFDFN